MSNDVMITEIEVVPVKPHEGLIGFASFVLDGKYYVGSVAVHTRLNGGGFRLVYPAKKVGERQINTFYPITQAVGRTIEDAVAEKVNEIVYDRGNENI